MNRFLSIVGVDLRFRFRRTATLITLLLVAMAVYFIVPDIRTGRTLMQVEGRRVIYNTPAVALGTSVLCSLLISLFGFYLTGNSFRRDLISRVAFVLGATPVKKSEYVLGKFSGGVFYLAAVYLTCMLSAMIMFFIRGEGPLEPFVFLGVYLWVGIPAAVFCAAMAVLFESLPVLSGRVGDVLFFFLWAAILGLPVALVENNSGATWVGMFDIVGIVPIIDLLQHQYHTSSISIGASDFNASLPPVVLNAIPWSWNFVVARIATLVMPSVLMVVAVLSFHRFDPTRIKSNLRHSRRNILSGINRMLKPLTRFLLPATSVAPGSSPSIVQTVRADVLVTFMLSPVAVPVLVVLIVLSWSLSASALTEGLVPTIVAVLILLLGDGAIRDRSARTISILFTAPHIKQNFLLIKFYSAFIVTLCFTFIPLLRLLFLKPSESVSLLIGSGFIAAGAVGLGMMTGNRKAFIAVYLMLLYIALNAKDLPVLDFAGFLGCATPIVQAGYAAMTAIILLAAYLKHGVMVSAM